MTSPTTTGPELAGDDAATTDAGTPEDPSSANAVTARGVVGWLGQVTIWLFILAALAVLAIALVIPRIGGATPYTVLTGSMQPGLPPGTLVVVKPVDTDEIVIGDVITYQLESGRSAVVTHRVIGVRTGVDGEPEFLTQGDANTAADPEPVRSVQVRGRLWYAVPHLGRVNTVLTGEQRQIGVYASAAALALYAGVMFAGGLRERRRHAT